MPEDKDFKRLVRARMADTGEPYTAARAGLRPELSDGVAQELAQFHDVVPMDLAALEAWRQDSPRPVPGEQPSSFGPHWELTVDAGGGLDALEPQPLDVATVAAFGSALGGVAYIAFGLDVISPAPEGSEPDAPGPPSRGSLAAAMEPLQRAHAHLQQQLREHLRGRPEYGGNPPWRSAAVELPRRSPVRNRPSHGSPRPARWVPRATPRSSARTSWRASNRSTMAISGVRSN